MVSIQRKISPYNRYVMMNKVNKYIVIHYVGGVSSAANNANYFYAADRSASANYFVDETSIWQVVEDFNAAWHCGDKIQDSSYHPYYKICTNQNSIGIEMCCKKDNYGNWYIEEDTIKNTIDLTKYLMEKYQISIDCVIRHRDVSGKVCPEPFVRNEALWIDFKDRLTKQEEEEEMTQEQFNEMMNVWIADTANAAPSDWSADFRAWAEKANLVRGDENGRMLYKKFLTREEFITVLYRVFNENSTTISDWSAEARAWAEKNNLTDGSNYTCPITKEQLITILYRFKGLIGK